MINPPPLTAIERIEWLEREVKSLRQEVEDLKGKDEPTPAILQRKREQRRH